MPSSNHGLGWPGPTNKGDRWWANGRRTRVERVRREGFFGSLFGSSIRYLDRSPAPGSAAAHGPSLLFAHEDILVPPRLSLVSLQLVGSCWGGQSEPIDPRSPNNFAPRVPSRHNIRTHAPRIRRKRKHQTTDNRFWIIFLGWCCCHTAPPYRSRASSRWSGNFELYFKLKPERALDFGRLWTVVIPKSNAYLSQTRSYSRPAGPVPTLVTYVRHVFSLIIHRFLSCRHG